MNSKCAGLLLAILVAVPALGDALEDADRLLCVPGAVFHCVVDQACKSEPPEDANIPEFIEVDLKRKTLATTHASGENRNTTVQHRMRQDGNIYLLGVEMGRAFVMTIAEMTGDMVFMVGADGQTGTMFGACTPD